MYAEPVYHPLCEQDFTQVAVINPAHAKALRGHKTDAKDCARLAEHQLQNWMTIKQAKEAGRLPPQLDKARRRVPDRQAPGGHAGHGSPPGARDGGL